MDIVDLINLLMYIPIGVAFAICCPIFLKHGYNKGFWRSLISLGASVAAILVSLLLGKLFGWLLSGPIANAMSGMIAGTQAGAGLVVAMVKGVVQAILSFVFFGIFLVVSVIVLKNVAKKIRWEKIEKEPKDKKGLRFAGMGIRWLDAVIVSLAVLLPLYGSFSVVTPVAGGMAGMAGGGSSSAARLLQTVSDHPTIVVYQVGPVSLVVDSLSTMNVDGESINSAEIIQTLEGLLTRFAVFTEADGDARVAALEDLVGYTRRNVIEKDWSYDVLQIVRQEYAKYLAQEEDPIGQQMYELADMSRAEFKNNGVALLEFVEYALQNDFMVFYKSSDYEALSPEFYEKLGELINHSEQAITFKKMLMKEAAAKMFEDERLGSDFVDRLVSDEPTAKELQKQEGEAFMRMVFEEHSKANLMEAFVRHPNIAYADVKDLLTEELLVDAYGHWTGDEYVLENSAKILADLQTKLATYETAPLTNETFRHYISTVVYEYNGEMYPYYDGYFEIEMGEDGEGTLPDEWIVQMNPDGSMTVIQDTP